MTVWEAVGTGFDGGFVPLGPHGVGLGVMAPLDEADVQWRIRRCEEVLEALGPRAWAAGSVVGEEASVEAFGKRAFVDLSVGEQRMVLLMRALVGRPPLVLLDEVWSGMDEGMVRAARKYLREGGVSDDQGVVVITHWEDEVPWDEEDGVRRFKLGETLPG
jgi:ABC-type molybdenum transport system ATPase subunit/photorepair protein PhrA